MPVRPLCVVMSTDLHGALGTQVVPPPPVPFTPSDITLWFAISTTYYGVGDEPVSSVFACGERLVNKGADTKYLRPHVVVTGLMPPTVKVGPIVDLGFILAVIGAGSTKPVWGSTSVKAGGKSVAVMAIPYAPMCPWNQLVCTDPFDMPRGFSVQLPSSVFVGMSLADYVLCAVSIVADMTISFVTNLLFGGLSELGKFGAEGLSSTILKWLGPKLGKLAKGGLSPVFDRIAEVASRVVGDRLGKMAGNAAQEVAKKVFGLVPDSLGIDDLLGFGNDPPVWAR